ncbi:MAG: hypothetical protein WCH10_02550 [bacterium]
MQIIKKICSKNLLATLLILLAIGYNQFCYANSNKYLTKWYEYRLQTAKSEIIDDSIIDEVADDLANNKKPIYSLIVDSNSISPNIDVLEKLLNALKKNTTIKELSFFNFSGENIEKIAKILNSKVFNYKNVKYYPIHDWLVSVDFTNNNDNANSLEESAAKEIGLLIKKGLISLNLSGNKIGTDDLAIIVRELPNSKLTHLYLNRIKISRGGIDTLANAFRKGRNSLVFLSLNQNNIDSDSAIQIIEATSSTYLLKNISLAENNIGNNKKFWQAMVNRINKYDVYNINLAKNNIDSDDIIEFILLTSYCSISMLNLAENKIDSKGVLAIADSKIWQESKTVINLNGNNIDSDAIMALTKTANTKEKLEGLNLGVVGIENPAVATNERNDL